MVSPRENQAFGQINQVTSASQPYRDSGKKTFSGDTRFKENDPSFDNPHGKINMDAMRKLADPQRGILDQTLSRNSAELIDENAISGLGKGLENTKSFFTGIFDSSTGVFSQLLGVASLGFKKAFSGKSKVLTWAMLGGGVLAGLAALKDFINAFKNWTSKERFDAGKPALIQTINAFLKAGLSAGLLAPFLKTKSPFEKEEHGKKEVKVKLLAGAILAPLLLDISMNIASGSSRLNRIPIFGDLLSGIFGPIYKGLDYMSRSEPTPNQGPPNPLAALGGAG